jgi:hypothetical protein
VDEGSEAGTMIDLIEIINKEDGQNVVQISTAEE